MSAGQGTDPGLYAGSVLVVGGGISGMQSSLDLANSGFKVYLLEKDTTLGGAMSKLDKTFPTNDCSMCIMAPKLVSTGRHHNIHIIPNSQITNINGQAGNFKVTISRRARYVDPNDCTGCGICAQYCPIMVKDDYNEGLRPRKAIFLRYAQAIPLVFSIDKDACIGCGTCESICRANAVKYDDNETESTLDVGSIILNPGFGLFDPRLKKEYGYGTYKNVLTSMELERMLSATGPSGGVVMRPSDGDIPKRIAFLQCVGSRDEQVKVPYCSSVCCMYSMKEAIIAMEHCEGMSPTIFFMDIRAHGKDFQKYYDRAKDEYRIRFVRSRVASIDEDPDTKNLILHYTDDNTPASEEFDMVVLAIGFQPPEDNHRLAGVTGIELNEYGFAKTSPFSPLKTNVPGIFASGAFAGPKDIPETVAQASGAAAKASSVIAGARGTDVTVKAYPAEKEVLGRPPRIGVFVCHCGINIGSVVRVPEVVEYARTLQDVVFAEHNLYTCSQDTQEHIKDMIKEHDLTRVVVASCTPRTHEPLFQDTCKEGGLNPYLFEMANIREHCSWVHMKDRDGATQKSKALVRMAVGKARMHVPQNLRGMPIKKAGLVIGGGLSGMTAALGLAQQGFESIIIEKEGELGGHLDHVKYLFDTDEDPQAELSDLKRRIKVDTRITIHLNSTLKKISGSAGAFRSTIETPNGEKEVEHGIVIVATGGMEYRPEEYLYGKSERVMTQSEFERIIFNGELDKEKVRKVVMIQCIGARTKENPNCSRVCCTIAVKNALKLKSLDPSMDVKVLYKDIRTYGLNEVHYTEARKAGVHFIRYDDDNLPNVALRDRSISVTLNDTILEKMIILDTDLLVLSAAIHPNPDNPKLSNILKVPLTKDGFFLEAHMKLSPIDFSTYGIFLCGLSHGPKMIGESLAQALGAVSRASTILSKDEIRGEPVTALVNPDLCSGCQTCVELCPFSAIEVVDTKAKVNDILCKGCGICSATCRNGAITQRMFEPEEMIEMIDAALDRMEVGQ